MDKVTFTVKEAAEMLGISSTKLYQLARNDEVPNIKFGKRCVIPRAKFLRWVEEIAQGGERHAR